MTISSENAPILFLVTLALVVVTAAVLGFRRDLRHSFALRAVLVVSMLALAVEVAFGVIFAWALLTMPDMRDF